MLKGEEGEKEGSGSGGEGEGNLCFAETRQKGRTKRGGRDQGRNSILLTCDTVYNGTTAHESVCLVVCVKPCHLWASLRGLFGSPESIYLSILRIGSESDVIGKK